LYVRREFSYESPVEIILKIGPYLPKLLSSIKCPGYTFLGHSADVCTEFDGKMHHGHAEMTRMTKILNRKLICVTSSNE